MQRRKSGKRMENKAKKKENLPTLKNFLWRLVLP